MLDRTKEEVDKLLSGEKSVEDVLKEQGEMTLPEIKDEILRKLKSMRPNEWSTRDILKEFTNWGDRDIWSGSAMANIDISDAYVLLGNLKDVVKDPSTPDHVIYDIADVLKV